MCKRHLCPRNLKNAASGPATARNGLPHVTKPANAHFTPTEQPYLFIKTGSGSTYLLVHSPHVHKRQGWARTELYLCLHRVQQALNCWNHHCCLPGPVSVGSWNQEPNPDPAELGKDMLTYILTAWLTIKSGMSI